MTTSPETETCILRVETPTGHPQGTGFILTPTLAVTCAHVVDACGVGPGNQIRLTLRARNAPTEAEVLVDGYHQEADVAFLRLTAPLPSGVTSAILSITRDGARIRAFGYPDVGEVNGLFGTGELVGTVTETDRPLLQLRSTQITAGFSGGPVWEETTGRVIGMVTSVAVPDDLARLDDVAFAIPAETLCDLCPEELELQPVVAMPDDALRAQELAYLDDLLTRYDYWLDHYTPLAGIAEVRAAIKDGPRLDLPMPFIPAGFEKLTEHGYGERAEVRREPVSDLRDAVAEHRRILLLGDPGSGKTTTMWRMAYDYASAAKADAQAPLPLLVPLGGYTGDGPFEAYLARHLGPLAPHLETYRASGRLILLLDGLNEMPQAGYAGRVDRIRTVLDRYPDDAVVVTCRALDYVVRMEELQKVEVSPLDEARIRDFLYNYLGNTAGERLFWAMAGGDEVGDLWDTWQRAGGTWDAFWMAEEMPRNVRRRMEWRSLRAWADLRKEPPELLSLGRNPYLLLMTAQVYAGAGGELPANRAKLFAAFVDTLLDREKKRHPQEWTTAECQKDGLAALAYAMQDERGRGTTVEREWASARLREAMPDYDAERLLYVAESAMLLDAPDTTDEDAAYVRFHHQLLQDYFAAQWLAPKLLDGSAPEMRINEEIRGFVRGLLAGADWRPQLPEGMEVPEGMVWVPPGPFIMGGEYGFPVQVVRIEEGFFVTRTPVTNAEYARFVEATGYEPPEHWRGKAPPDELHDHPVVDVSWHDCVAYAEWAGGRLLTEQEWEKAARGIDGRDHPWGDEFDPARCNTRESGIGATTPVGRYSLGFHPELVEGGDSPCRCADMAGNVWEWTASEYEPGSARRVVRGGSFLDLQEFARASVRFGFIPDDRDWDRGCRVVAAPFSPTSAL